MAKIGDIGAGFGVGAAGPAPSAPSLSLAVSGNDVIATIDGDTDVTNYLVYKAYSDAAWIAGGNRAGDGDITVEDLTSGVLYSFVAYSNNDNGNSEPSPSVDVRIVIDTVSDLDQDLLDDADEFLNAFGDYENITYMPFGGSLREIRAIVDRFGPGGIPGSPAGTTKINSITVKNSAIDGISSSEVDSGEDRILIANRIGGSQISKKLTRIQLQDVGMVTYKVA